jgi:hypothetical protein
MEVITSLFVFDSSTYRKQEAPLFLQQQGFLFICRLQLFEIRKRYGFPHAASQVTYQQFVNEVNGPKYIMDDQ